MKRQWKGTFPPVDESFERSMYRVFEVMRKENRQAKEKVGVGLILGDRIGVGQHHGSGHKTIRRFELCLLASYGIA